MKLLLVEDDHKIADFISQGLQEAGFVVDHIDNGTQGLEMALNRSYDIAVIDIMLPGLDGLNLIGAMRRKKKNTPVLILSSKRSVDERVTGLTAGGDDYLTKPFAFSELLARIQALIRRSRGESLQTVFEVGDVKLDILSRKVYRGDQLIDLQPLEFSLLEYLMRNAGRIVSKTMIMEHVWDYNFNPQTNVVEARICHLRDKIDKDYTTKMIHTVRGVGYAFRENS
ncbi:MAG: response regulator transcription factor [Desulfohalobiaceae bacterium]|nr:response regulator transcription factor [Desulfohalobiaceae bacterium]